MDFNVAVIAGSLAAPPEIREFESGSRCARYLICTTTDEPRRRTDVIPVTLWNPSAELLAVDPAPGRRLFAAGSVQRRFRSATEDRRSNIEVIAHAIEFRDPRDGDVTADG